MAFFIRARSKWTRRPNVDFTRVEWQKPGAYRRVHHTADSGPEGGSKATVAQEIAYLRRLEDFHVNTRGYIALAYNYVVMPSGRVYEGRGFEKQGAHTLSHNEDIGICFAGSFQTRRPTLAAKAGYLDLIRKLRDHGVPIAKVYPHNATFNTTCPGDALWKFLNG